MYASRGCGALSAKSTAGPNILDYFLFPWGVTLDSAETPFAKTPFSWFLSFGVGNFLGLFRSAEVPP